MSEDDVLELVGVVQAWLAERGYSADVLGTREPDALTLVICHGALPGGETEGTNDE